MIKHDPNKITATMKLVVTREFYDDEASEETLRYCIEQDLEDAGFDVDISLLKEQKAVVRCKDCKHRPKEPNWKTYENGFDIEFPEDSKCPCQCSDDEYYSWYPRDDWFCANGERRTNNV